MSQSIDNVPELGTVYIHVYNGGIGKHVFWDQENIRVFNITSNTVSYQYISKYIYIC